MAHSDVSSATFEISASSHAPTTGSSSSHLASSASARVPRMERRKPKEISRGKKSNSPPTSSPGASEGAAVTKVRKSRSIEKTDRSKQPHKVRASFENPLPAEDSQDETFMCDENGEVVMVRDVRGKWHGSKGTYVSAPSEDIREFIYYMVRPSG